MTDSPCYSALQEEMLSSMSLTSDASAIHVAGNTIGELALALF